MTEKRFGFIAVIGPPNAGKSTLSNALVGQKVAIVTHKAQTTRARLRAVVMHEQSQVVLVDTPGIFSGVKKTVFLGKYSKYFFEYSKTCGVDGKIKFASGKTLENFSKV